MAIKFEIIGNNLVATNTDTSAVLFDEFAKESSYVSSKLDSGIVQVVYPITGNKNPSQAWGDVIRYSASLSDAVDSNNTSFTAATFRDFCRNNLGKSSGGSTSLSTYYGEFTNYNALVAAYPSGAGTAGRFAYVLNSQGTQWLPSTLGGTYYGAGWYYDTGSMWTNKNDAVFNALEPTQKQGFINYNDTTGAVSITSNTWTTIPNNGLGTSTNKTYKPDGVTELMDTSTGAIDVSDLALGDTIIIRNDFSINPHNNHTLLEFRYTLGTGANAYTLESIIKRLDNGSGVNYRFSLKSDLIYLGDTNTKDNPIGLQIRLSSAGTLTNAGSVIQLVKGKL